MTTENQRLIQKARTAFALARRDRSKQKKESRGLHEKVHAELTLLADDLKAEGVDITTPEGNAIFALVVAQKMARMKGGGEGCGVEDWMKGL
jgi:hypothetical protein